MKDSFNRKIHYLRISITDVCNLRCTYCLPEDVKFFPKSQILSYDEIIRLSHIMATLGIDAVRLTGGEPLVRADCVNIVSELKKMKGIRKVSLTTNGVFLPKYIDELAYNKLDDLNISLDTLNEDLFNKITGRNQFAKVMEGIYRALDYGINVKINCVLMRGINDKEVLPLANLTKTLPVGVRFIELMPTDDSLNRLQGVNSDEVIEMLANDFADLSQDLTPHGLGPAHYLKTKDMVGSIGFIDPMSHNFCSRCNKIRLTAEGFLKLCLYHDDGVSLRDLMRNGASDEMIKDIIVSSVFKKPEKHFFNEKPNFKTMSKIGG